MAVSRRMMLSILLAHVFCGSLWGQPGPVVINEIHYDPDLKVEWVEFVELYNAGPAAVDLSGWYFSDGISFTFDAGATLPAGGYVVVAQDCGDVLTKWTALTAGKVFGPFGGKLNNEGERLVLRDATGAVADEVDYRLGFPWPIVGDPVPENVPGTGHSIQLMNPQLDNDLGGSWRSASPTPGVRNAAVFAENTPPHVRQVEHTPREPRSGDVVTITAKVTDSDGITAVMLTCQVVDPGAYVPVTLPNYPSSNPATVPNPAYANNWQVFTMRDDGTAGDQAAGDSVYTVQLPSSVQRHRRLVRYRLSAIDNLGNFLRAPYEDDPQPHFAYFVYDGVPAWSGAIQPGSSDASRAKVVTYSEDLMCSLPVYHLISRATDIQNCLFNGSYDNTSYYFSGALVYDGEVYDNIHYRIRGQASTFQTGKNKLKVDFNRGHYFQACDDYGQEYQEKWDKMNVGTGVCPWWQYPHPGSWDRGTQGMVMNEALAFRLYNMAGVPSCNTNYFQLRIIDAAAEADPSNQYEGDFWGLYFAIEHPDGAFLDEHGLPDGNVYRMDGGANATHQGPTRIANGSDVSSLINGMSTGQNAEWWARNVNLPNYYSSKAIGVAINDSDRRPQSNCVYYCDSETNQWWVLPWDLDLTFEWATHYTDWEHFRYALVHPQYEIACDNRGRELLDLLLSSDQARQVVDEITSVIAAPHEGRTFVEANRAMWDYHPRTNRKGQFYANNEFLKTKDWPGLVEYYKTFLSSQGFSDIGSGSYGVYALLADTADSAIPNTPEVSYTGDAAYPPNGLAFQATAFADPQGVNTFAAIQWRIAEVEPNTPISPPVESGIAYQGRRGRYEIDALWESGEIETPNGADAVIPASVVESGHTYRVRCRMKDTTGRWSHWSGPIQFETGVPLPAHIVDDLRLTEIMYNPSEADAGKGELTLDNDSFEFIELCNIGSTTLDLTGVSFEDGIAFSFGGSRIERLPPGGFVLVVQNEAAFISRYGEEMATLIAGQYDGKLANDGETLRLVDFWNGAIVEFNYGDDWFPSTDGGGFSLTVADPQRNPDALSEPASWRPSAIFGGSPGRDDNGN